LDRKLDPKGRTFLGMAAAVSLVFATYFGFEQVSRHAIVRPAIGSLLAAFIGGGIGRWLVTAIVKKMTPEEKRPPHRAQALQSARALSAMSRSVAAVGPPASSTNAAITTCWPDGGVTMPTSFAQSASAPSPARLEQVPVRSPTGVFGGRPARRRRAPV